MNMPVFASEVGRGIFWPGSVIYRWMMDQLFSGDTAISARLMLGLVQTQGILVMGVQSGLFVAAVVTVNVDLVLRTN